MNNTFPVILDYCGGTKTDRLYEKLQEGNEDIFIYVLDNASPTNTSRYITHRNTTNTFVGGGICDCIHLAKENRCEILLFITNDVVLTSPIDLAFLSSIITADKNIVQVSVSLTPASDKSCYPWMIDRGRNEFREVHHSDFIFSFIRIAFIEEFGGFPDSKSGWGYDWEFSYHARKKNKKILIGDQFQIEHKSNNEDTLWKEEELRKVYDKKYGSFSKISPHFVDIQRDQNKHIVDKCASLSPIIIIGMHRSGTSYLTRILEKAGVFMGYEKDPNCESLVFLKLNMLCLKKSGFSWAKPGLASTWIDSDMFGYVIMSHFGFYQYCKEQIDSLDKISWGWKDPRNTFTLAMWLSFFPNARVIHMHRNGWAVAESLYRRNSNLQPQSPYYVKELVSKKFGFKLWEKYVRTAEMYKTEIRSKFLSVCYEKIIMGDIREIDRLERFVGFGLRAIVEEMTDKEKRKQVDRT